MSNVRNCTRNDELKTVNMKSHYDQKRIKAEIVNVNDNVFVSKPPIKSYKITLCMEWTTYS